MMRAQHQMKHAACFQRLFAAGLRVAAKRPAAVAIALAEPCDCAVY